MKIFMSLLSLLVLQTAYASHEHMEEGHQQTPKVNYTDISHIPTDLSETFVLTLNGKDWHFRWHSMNLLPITSIWSEEEYDFFVEPSPDSDINTACGKLRFASYSIKAIRKADQKSINPFHYVFYLIEPNNR